MKTCKLLAAFLLAVTVLAACSDDSPSVPQPPVSAGGAGVYVINQGNYYGGVSGTVDALSFADSTYADNFFESANGISVGDSPSRVWLMVRRYTFRCMLPILCGYLTRPR